MKPPKSWSNAKWGWSRRPWKRSWWNDSIASYRPHIANTARSASTTDTIRQKLSIICLSCWSFPGHTGFPLWKRNVSNVWFIGVVKGILKPPWKSWRDIPIFWSKWLRVITEIRYRRIRIRNDSLITETVFILFARSILQPTLTIGVFIFDNVC